MAPVLVFDIEAVPDTEGLRKIHGLGPQLAPADIACGIWRSLGLSVPRPLVGALRGQKRHRAGGFSRKTQQLRRRHANVRNNAPAHFRASHAIAEVG